MSKACRRQMQEEQRAAKLSQSPQSTQVVLMRHGETEWNVCGRLQGQLDPPLNENGLCQAATLASHYAQNPGTCPFDAIYSSDLTRARQTADAIAAPHKATVCLSAQLRERHLGPLQGLTIKEAQSVCPGALQQLYGHLEQIIEEQDSESVQGESVDMLCERVSKEIERIASNHKGQRVLLVVHGGVIAAAHRRATGHAAPRAHNGSVHTLCVLGSKWAVLSWGDSTALGGEGSSEAFGGGNEGG